MNTTLAVLQVDSLSRRFGALHAVDAVSFSLQRGQVLGWLGPNGAGKSTTLRMLAGVLAPDAGQIVINGADLFDQPRLARQALGYLPEPPPLYRELRVEEQLRFSARLHGLSRVASRRAVADTLARCGLEAVQRRLIGHLSRGYQQRVGIAQTLLHDPPLLLLDEPTTGLDPLQVAELHQLIRELGRDHGVIFSTHRLADVRAVCTHVQIMRDGRLVYAGALAELERGDLTTALRVGFERSPPLTALAALPGVTAVEPLGRDRFRLRHAPGANLARMLVEQAVAAGWGLCELIPEGAGLEQRCIELLLGTEEAS